MEQNVTFGREELLGMLGRYFGDGKFEEDFASLTPMQRLEIASRLMNYALPRLKAVGMEVLSNPVRKDPPPASLLELLFPDGDI